MISQFNIPFFICVHPYYARCYLHCMSHVSFHHRHCMNFHHRYMSYASCYRYCMSCYFHYKNCANCFHCYRNCCASCCSMTMSYGLSMSKTMTSCVCCWVGYTMNRQMSCCCARCF